MNKKLIILGMIFIAAALLILSLNKNKTESKENQMTAPKNINENNKTNENQNSKNSAQPSGTKKFKLTAKRFAYEPETIEVSLGDKVVLEIKSNDVPHSFTLPEFGDQSKGGINELLKPKETKTIEFEATKAGEFTFGCDVACGKGHSMMLGKLVVKQK